MQKRQAPKDLSLKWLEIFQICARHGALQDAAKEAGLSISTVSHHLRSLEAHLGVELFDHARRPMVLTPKGRVFLRNIDGALIAIRKAKAEASAGDIATASYLRIGVVEDFDSDITPELAVYLAGQMPSCDFLYVTDTSLALFDKLRNRALDLAISTEPAEKLGDLADRPLIKDPFIVVLPAGFEGSVADVVEGRSALPFLQFSDNLIIARQIEAQLRRLGLLAPRQFSCSSNQTLMAMVAAGAGWTITTPLLYARGLRFHDKLAMHPFPGKSFARTLLILATPDCSRSVIDVVDTKMQALLSQHVIDPLTARAPWLADSLTLIR
ncbi:MAG: LysR family transcriptional regulator [Pseudomonadota bacterium]